MNLFQYIEDNGIRCLAGKFTEHTYQECIYRRKEQLRNLLNICLSDQCDSTHLGKMAFQYDLIANHRFEKWEYPVFCFNLFRSYHVAPEFRVTKGSNKVYANFLARRPRTDIPVALVNYGKILDHIVVEKDINTQAELEQYVGAPMDLYCEYFKHDDGTQYAIISHIRELKILSTETAHISRWLNLLRSYMVNEQIPVHVQDNFSSDITDSSGLFKFVKQTPRLELPQGVERSTHIREYKVLLRNDESDLPCITLITNKQIKLDLFDMIWFFKDSSSDYTSTDRSYSLLCPGPYRADTDLPGSELQNS